MHFQTKQDWKKEDEKKIGVIVDGSYAWKTEETR